MTTSAIASIFAQDTNAHFQAWVTEVVTALFTTLGVTQTADTGQINPATATIPAATGSAGYVIGRFNDALQSTAPIFFKLEFGAGPNTNDPAMYLTVGTGSNGSGTITNGGGGAITTRVAAMNPGQAAVSLTTAYTSQYVYIATTQIAFLGVMMKYGSLTSGNNNVAFGSFFIFRTTDNNGNATGNGVCVLTSNNVTGFQGAASNGYEQNISFANAAIIPTTPANGWESLDRALILGLSTLLESSTSFILPIYTVDPVVRLSAYVGTAMLADFAVGTTAPATLVGATSTTMISAGSPFGNLSYNNGGSKTLCVPWQ
jgi:hypothetical protein